MIHPLTPQEKAELNAWIAENITHHQSTVHYLEEHGTDGYYWCASCADTFLPEEKSIENYTDDWSAAGLLFDRYPMWILTQAPSGNLYNVYWNWPNESVETHLASGTTGPEAIAKAVKQYEEQRRER